GGGIIGISRRRNTRSPSESPPDRREEGGSRRGGRRSARDRGRDRAGQRHPPSRGPMSPDQAGTELSEASDAAEPSLAEATFSPSLNRTKRRSRASLPARSTTTCPTVFSGSLTKACSTSTASW